RGGPHHGPADAPPVRCARRPRHGDGCTEPPGNLERGTLECCDCCRAERAARSGTLKGAGRMTHDLPHVPVMPQETVDWLEAAPGKIIVDGTFGAGGHSRLLLEAGADVIGIDQDPAARTYAAQ